jgi:heme exporter protein B
MATSSPQRPGRWQMVWLIAHKDLRIEWRSRITTNQVVPFAVVVMVMFAFALDTENVLQRVAPGLVWLAVLFSMLVMVQRSAALESEDGALDALRISGVDPVSIFWGKALALSAQLFVLLVLLLATAFVLYRADLRSSGLVLLVTTSITATSGLGIVGTLYGGLAAGRSGRETLLPLLVLPVVAPVLIGATRAAESALGTGGAVVSEGWPWVGLLAVFAVAFGVGGSLGYGTLIDDQAGSTA